jgi:hypothetical protein
MTNVSKRALNGSPRKLDENGFRNGMISSLATACSKRGAPVNDCNAAPTVDANAPFQNFEARYIEFEDRFRKKRSGALLQIVSRFQIFFQKSVWMMLN